MQNKNNSKINHINFVQQILNITVSITIFNNSRESTQPLTDTLQEGV